MQQPCILNFTPANNKYAMIDFYSYNLIFGDTANRSIYILEKKEGKWVVIKDFFYGVYF